MNNKISWHLIAFLFVAIFAGCNNLTNTSNASTKFQPSDPFRNSITASNYFEINSKQDTVIEGDKGTIVVCPKGCFRNAKGEIVEGHVKIELAEALSLDEMILSNLTTTSNGSQLETDGMIYFNATANGEQLTINEGNPVHIEIPTKEKKSGMMAYRGQRDVNGNMNWTEPKALDNFLVPVNPNLLDFLPEGFQAEVEKGMPYKDYAIATKELTDSLYFQLSVSDGSELTKGFVNTDLNEAYYNKQSTVVNGKYTKNSYQVHDVPSDTARTDATPRRNCGIDPAIIKVLKSKKYENTLIDTKEFEARLKVIFKTCDNGVLEIYSKNIGKNLYELDSLAEVKTHGDEYETYFHNFYLQKLTNVKNADKYAALLKGYYEEQLSKTKSELEKAKENLVNALKQKNKEVEKLTDDYKELLWQREKYRMETYGFNWTNTGWINVDRGTIPKTWGPQRLEIKIENVKNYDRNYVYTVYTTIKSIYRLNNDDNKLFYVGNNEEKVMLMPKHADAYAIAISYKGETPYLAIKQFETGTDKQLALNPQASTTDKIKLAINAYDNYAKENQISMDLEYMDKFFIEQVRQKALIKESEFIKNLWYVAYPCCLSPSAPAAVK